MSSTSKTLEEKYQKKSQIEHVLDRPDTYVDSIKVQEDMMDIFDDDLQKVIRKNKNIKFIIFRFFNVCSSIPELKVGENHKPETHLIPSTIQKVLRGKIIKIYGKNYKTKDGTCIRDYIHIKDLCVAYEKTIKLLKLKIFNKQ